MPFVRVHQRLCLPPPVFWLPASFRPRSTIMCWLRQVRVCLVDRVFSQGRWNRLSALNRHSQPALYVHSQPAYMAVHRVHDGLQDLAVGAGPLQGLRLNSSTWLWG